MVLLVIMHKWIIWKIDDKFPSPDSIIQFAQLAQYNLQLQVINFSLLLYFQYKPK